MKKLKQKHDRNTFKKTIKQEFETAPVEEIAMLAYLVTMNRKAFSAGFNDKRLSPLVTKGLVIQLGGAHGMMEWPYIIQDDVWQLLLEGKEQFHIPNADQIPNPFDWRNSPV